MLEDASWRTWQELITAFRPHILMSWTRPTISKWNYLLNSSSIFVYPDRYISQVESMIDFLYNEEHIGTKSLFKSEN